MGKIIPFRLPCSDESIYKPPAQHKKQPIVITVMPDQKFPIGHIDFRPILQRDGLILMSWALWLDWDEDQSYKQVYVVNWLASQGKYRLYATKGVYKERLDKAVPERDGDLYFYRGLYGRHYSLKSYRDIEAADYVYLVAPFDLCKKTIPEFIQLLRSTGSNADFDYVFSLEKESLSQARAYLGKGSSTETGKLNRQA
jgi:hypothetical protein